MPHPTASGMTFLFNIIRASLTGDNRLTGARRMKQCFFLAALLAGGIGLMHGSAEASGSIGAGAGKVSPRAAYSQGKALTFDLLVCDSCPLQKNDLDRDRAEKLTTSLVAVFGGNETGSPDDDAVRAVCGGGAVQGAECDLRMELVHYFLTRRFKL